MGITGMESGLFHIPVRIPPLSPPPDLGTGGGITGFFTCFLHWRAAENLGLFNPLEIVFECKNDEKSVQHFLALRAAIK